MFAIASKMKPSCQTLTNVIKKQIKWLLISRLFLHTSMRIGRSRWITGSTAGYGGSNGFIIEMAAGELDTANAQRQV